MQSWLNRTWIIERHRRHRAQFLGVPARPLVAILWALGALLSAVPYVQRLAWVLPLVLLWLETRSRMLRRAAADQFLLLLTYSLLLGVLQFVQDLVLRATLGNPAGGPSYTASLILAQERAGYVDAVAGVLWTFWLAYSICGLYASSRYGLLRFRRLRRLSGLVQDVVSRPKF